MTEIIEFSRESKFTFEPFETITPQAQPWRVKGVLPARGVAFLVGQSKAGKTFVALDATLRLAAGIPKVLGRKARQCGVVYVAAEDPNGCRSRVTAWRRNTRTAQYVPFEMIGQGFDLLNPEDVADLRASLAEARARFDERGIELGVIVLDTLSRVIPGVDENSSTDMSSAFTVLENLTRETGALVLVVAHFGKAGAEKGIRGWSGMDANSDATITVERNEEDRELRLITFAKVKNGVDGGQLAFRLEQVDLGIIDDDGDPLVSCVPVYQSLEAAARPKRVKALSNPEKVVLAAIKHVTDNGSTHPLPANVEGAKPSTKAVTREDIRHRALDAGLAQGDKASTVRMRFSRAIEGLSAAQKIRVEGELIWLL
jgi:hypothetical protein